MNRKEEMELLPCPFCGGEANMRRFISRDTPIQPIEITHIQCVNDDYCHVSVDIQHINEAVAVAAWNTRAALAPATDNKNYVVLLERIAEIIRDETKTTWDGTIYNSTDVAKKILNILSENK